MQKDFLSKVADLNPKWLWLVVVLLIVALFAPLIADQAWRPWLDFSNDGNGNIGSFIGGVVTPFLSLATIALVFLTYASQRKELAETSKTLGLQQFENAYFELLKVHRENVSQLKYEDERGRNCFIRFKQELEYITNKIDDHDDFEDLRDVDRIDKYVLSYHFFFYGVNTISSETINLCFKQNVELTERHISRLQRLNSAYQARVNERRRDLTNPFSGWGLGREFGIEGQRSNLGHYFRHLFQMVRFVHEHQVFQNYNDEVSKELRYQYVKMIRAQLSDIELAIFFIGSLHRLGWDWEWNWSEKNPNRESGRKVRNFITGYRLLKNIPKDIFEGVDVQDYYPGDYYVNY